MTGPTAAEELLDAVDPDTGAVLATLPRSEVHARGLWHDVFHCLVVRSSGDTVVLQRRAATKAAFPDRLDVSVSGHLASGESPIDGVREAREELGVDVDPALLVPVDVWTQEVTAGAGGEGTDRERAHRFVLVDDRPLDAFRPPVAEVAALVEIRVADLLAALDDPTLDAPALQSTDGASPHPIALRRAELVHEDRAHWLPLLTSHG